MTFLLLSNMRAGVEKSDSEVYSELEIFRASKTGHWEPESEGYKASKNQV